MPNNVTNTVMIKAPAVVLAHIKSELEGPDRPFDFDKVVPMPDELKSIQTGRTTIGGVACERWIEHADGTSEPITPLKESQLIEAHGAADWYQWALAHWGTKWNSYACRPARLTRRALHYVFDTAWGPPEKVYQAVADRYCVEIRVKLSGEIDNPETLHYSGFAEPEPDDHPVNVK